MNKQDQVKQIYTLKKEQNAVILAHNYQLPEIQDIADFIGDSLELSRKAAETNADTIVFCGVSFMAETAKILAPHKKVLLPAMHAGCPMADMINSAQLLALKKLHQDSQIVCYVNSSAEVKAVSDICCTSANAVKIVESLTSDNIIFVPDEGLGSYTAENSSKNILLFPGYCPTHYLLRAEDAIQARTRHPKAKTLVHPECRKEVRDLSDKIAGTGGMISFISQDTSDEYIIGTEEGMIYRLQTIFPDKIFHLMSTKLYCPNMKKTTLGHVAQALELQQHEMTLSEHIMEKASAAILRMLAVD